MKRRARIEIDPYEEADRLARADHAARMAVLAADPAAVARGAKAGQRIAEFRAAEVADRAAHPEKYAAADRAAAEHVAAGHRLADLIQAERRDLHEQAERDAAEDAAL